MSQLQELNLFYSNRELIDSGYGQTGPLSQKPGYDVMVEAEFGLMSITGHPDGKPTKVGVAITDLTTGLYAVNAILTALFHRERSPLREGQYIDVALSDCQLASLTNVASSVLHGGTSQRWGNAHGNIVPYQSFPSLDGEIVIGCGNNIQFQKFLALVGREDIAKDERFSTNKSRVKHRNTLVPLLEGITQSKTTSEWEILLENTGIPCAPINDVKASLEHPHSLSRNMVQDHGNKDTGEMRLIGHPIKYITLDVGIKKRPPMLGEDSSDVLSRILGKNKDQIARLKHDGVIM
ncbi:Succinate--hydroxymethylglutarate CoA-transferase [Neolecta irregularis DAH-3]|uniref:Succinate--hydroxymethylglutarate CoA-transferase n=1 Tax=Neolecta irregularis (strain DAH-3) TaxID=1198029 RepID=A0A1U7LIW3_NEOID|nr:Succinate--hydroxymethylglutarate CoA-transferase [Neolecta irregularis DAH-3]|eukprot:OLL22600.1 Succinate--hydroxymethylglutarate CoA-transferase [Neolecta irregularis DAH-3]